MTNGADGEPIRGLGCEDIRLYDNRRLQDLIACEPDRAPLHVVLVVDRSSLEAVSDRGFRRGLRRGLAGLREHDRVALLSMDHGDLRWLHDFTVDPEPVAALLRRYNPPPADGSTRQPSYDAIAEAAAKLQGSEGARRVILVLSNDRERGSQMTPDRAANEALKAGATVCHIILDNNGGAAQVAVPLPFPLPQPKVRVSGPPVPVLSQGMVSVVRKTGGDRIAAGASRHALTSAISGVRDRYVLSYRQPSAREGEFRVLSVALSESAGRKYPEAVVRTRSGYYVGAVD